jgi:uncharacterized protein (TIGR00255 family)
MPLSMTGFGRGVRKAGGVRYVVEARSVNNRFCEVRIQAPRELLALEHRLSARVRERFERGKFDLLLKVEMPGDRNRKENGAVLRRFKELEQLRKKLGLKEPVRLETALAQTAQPTPYPEEGVLQKNLERAAEEALDKLAVFRKREGHALTRDLRTRTARLRKMAGEVSVQAAKGTAQRLERMRERVKALADGRPLDPGRLEAEMAILADRSDVTEELVRLETHLAGLLSTLEAPGSVGRKLDFLLQEIQREANTIGSKANDLGVTDLVVSIKSEIEKVREQAQNLE